MFYWLSGVRWLSGVEAKVAAMTLIPALRQTVNQIGIACHQCLFFLAAPTLNLFLSNISIFNSFAFFAVNQSNRQTLGSVFGTQAILVFPQPALQIPGAAGIVAAV